jgi:hypothetical protein
VTASTPVYHGKTQGVTGEALARGYRAAHKRDASLTAAQFLGVRSPWGWAGS